MKKEPEVHTKLDPSEYLDYRGNSYFTRVVTYHGSREDVRRYLTEANRLLASGPWVCATRGRGQSFKSSPINHIDPKDYGVRVEEIMEHGMILGASRHGPFIENDEKTVYREPVIIPSCVVRKRPPLKPTEPKRRPWLGYD